MNIWTKWQTQVVMFLIATGLIYLIGDAINTSASLIK